LPAGVELQDLDELARLLADPLAIHLRLGRSAGCEHVASSTGIRSSASIIVPPHIIVLAIAA
jgi:hypothetical protein